MQDGNNILYGTGDDPFLKGIRIWLKARLYGTSTTDQLWQAMSSAVGRNVGTWMHGWSYESGFPLVRVTLGGITNRDVSISQVWNCMLRWILKLPDCSHNIRTLKPVLIPELGAI